jgi:hypothetical protein
MELILPTSSGTSYGVPLLKEKKVSLKIKWTNTKNIWVKHYKI